MRMLLFSLLIGLGLVAHQAIAEHVRGPDMTVQAAAVHDHANNGRSDAGQAEHGTAEHGTGHGYAGCEHSLACGMQATCSPAILMLAAELVVEPRPMTELSGLPLTYASHHSPPAAPPPRI